MIRFYAILKNPDSILLQHERYSRPAGPPCTLQCGGWSGFRNRGCIATASCCINGKNNDFQEEPSWTAGGFLLTLPAPGLCTDDI